MTELRAAQPESLLSWIDSLGDPSRLRLLRLLERHELGVAEMGDILQLPQSTISRHLKVLTDAGWLRSRRVGTAHLSTMALDQLDAGQRKLWELSREQMTDWPNAKQDEMRLQRRLAGRQDDSRRFFTGAAAEWDKLREQIYGYTFSTTASLALLDPRMTVADLGCGTGHLLEKLSPHVGRVIGVDNTPAMIAAAGQRTIELGNVELRQGELESLPLQSQSVDAAVMVLALSYVAEPLLCVREMTRALKSGGRAVVVDITLHGNDDFRRQMGQSRLGFELSEMAELLTTAGLIGVQARTLPTESAARGPALLLASGRRS